MSAPQTLAGVYGPGTHTDRDFKPVPQEAERILRLIASETPGFTKDEKLLSKVEFEGEDYPVLPGPIKAVEVASALHAMTGVLAEEILALRGLASDESSITVNTTHVAFWLASIAFAYLEGEESLALASQKKLDALYPNFEQGWVDTPLKYRTTAIYPTKNPEVWYSLHGSLDATPVLKSLGVDPAQPAASNEEAYELLSSATRTLSPEELEFHNLQNGLCGSICFTPEAWNNSSMGKSLAQHPLVNVKAQPQAIPTPPITFPPVNLSDKRPLAGIKVVEMTRVIAGPQIGTILAAYGADVIRISPPHLRDINILQLTLNAGKRTIGIDLREQQDREILFNLVKDADIFIQGFRQGKMAKYGLGVDDLLQIAAKRERGIVYVSENCYGPDGYYAERPGWQQIADAAAGSAYVTGRSLNLPTEAVLPSLPISDMTTGLLGAVGAMLGLKRRATEGGSYVAHASLAAVNTYALKPEVGLYPRNTVEENSKKFAFAEMRGAHHVLDLLVTVYHGWKRVFGESYLREESGWFQSFEKSAFGGKRLSVLKPVVRLSDSESTPSWRTPSVPYCFYDKTATKF
ncbi:CoA-transferase family III [Periconia macrospinosa]|uniref:CoA-transferase family III n=1 Tax=Periconia macrospinosa TaxID=97972 RepID=A0A2V1E587_9PLEO|nr:CoA-transferase family III [Periconia macrospinosa]